MNAPRFSVVIPTRERADTLRFALRTCLDQAFDDYEIVVSDNYSSPATREVVDEIASPKVRYVRTPEPVAMSTNWEFAVSHARGEFVVLIGDDDGLLPHALDALDALARDHGAKAIRWDAAYYTWPTVALPGQGNYLRIPLGRYTRERDGADAIRAVAEFREFYTALPMLYNAAVHRDVLADLRRRVGRVFPHPVPDVYSGFAVAHAAGRFLSVTAPMTVSGQSRASNGIATLFNPERSEIAREFHALNARDGLRSESTVPDLPVFPHVPVADTFAFAKRALFPELPVELDRRALATACVAGARVVEAEWPLALAAVRASLADDAELQAWFDRELAAAPFPGLPPVQLRPDRLVPDADGLRIDAAAFGVTDVAGAAELCERVLGYRQFGLDLAPEPISREVLYAQLAEKEAEIHRAHAASQELTAGWVRSDQTVRSEQEARVQLQARYEAQRREQDLQSVRQNELIRELTVELSRLRGWRGLLRHAARTLRGRGAA